MFEHADSLSDKCRDGNEAVGSRGTDGLLSNRKACEDLLVLPRCSSTQAGSCTSFLAAKRIELRNPVARYVCHFSGKT